MMAHPVLADTQMNRLDAYHLEERRDGGEEVLVVIELAHRVVGLASTVVAVRPEGVGPAANISEIP